MDDFILLVPNKVIAKEIYTKINLFITSELKLELNNFNFYIDNSKH